MEHARFVGLDIHKERISVAEAESGRSGAVEYHGEIANDPAAISKLRDRLGRSGNPLAFCYEAGVDLHFNGSSSLPVAVVTTQEAGAHVGVLVLLDHTSFV